MTATSFIAARHDEDIARAEEKLRRCEYKLKQAPSKNEKRMGSIWREAEAMQRSRDRVAEAYRGTLGVATEKAADTLGRALFKDERAQLSWRNEMRMLNGWGYNVYDVYGSIIAPAFNAVHYAEQQLIEAKRELQRAREVKFAARYRALAGAIIVEASEKHLVAELSHGGFCRIEPLDAAGNLSSFRGQLPLIATDSPFDGLIGVQIIEPSARQDRDGEMFPILRIADAFETGEIDPLEDLDESSDGRAPGSFRLTECDWEPAPTIHSPTYPIHEVKDGWRGQKVDSGDYVRRVNGELQILRTSGWSCGSDNESVDVEVLYRDNYRTQYGEQVQIKATELGQLICLPEHKRHMVSSGAGLLSTMQGENPLKRVRESISSMGYNGEDQEWGLDERYYRGEDDDADGSNYELSRIRATIMNRLGIKLDRNWSWR